MHGAAHRQRSRGRGLSLRARLVMLVLAFLVPGLLITGFLLWNLDRAGRAVQERQLTATARALALVVDRQIGEQAATLQTLVSAPSLKAGDWSAFDAQARDALRNQPAWVVVRSPGGPFHVNTRSPRGAPPPPTLRPTSQASWAGLRHGASVSNLYTGTLVNEPVVIVRRTITLDNGQPVYVSVATLASTFTQVFRDQGLPDGWIGGVLDADGRTVARNEHQARFVGRKASPLTLDAVAKGGSGIFQNRTFDGIRVSTAFDVLPDYKWSVLVAVPLDELVGPARRSLMAWLGLGVLLLCAAVLLAIRVAGGVATPVESLAKAADDWVHGRVVSVPQGSGLPETDGLGAAFAGALAAVEARDAQQSLLINELNHRVKNTLATVQSIALHARRANASAEDFHTTFEGRLMAMSGAHDLLTRTAWEGAALDDVLRTALRPFLDQRFAIQGPKVQVGPTTALNLSLIIYELATNAAKYGALSAMDGKVALTWRPLGDKVQIRWAETGGPALKPPSRKGFGSRLIERAARDLQPASLDFAPQGVCCTLTIDVAGPEAVRAFAISPEVWRPQGEMDTGSPRPGVLNV